MNYSQVSISNLALGRLGARGQIVSITDNSPNAVKVLNVWDAIFQEVSSERDWKSMKTRQQLALSPVTPLYGFLYAWALPADFLRFVRPYKRPTDGRNFAWMPGPEGVGWYCNNDPPFWPPDCNYRVETLTAGWDNSVTPPVPYGSNKTPPTPFPVGKYALTNYGGDQGPVAINYIQLITDYSQLMPGFVNCLANRLAMELAISITEDKAKFQGLQEMYRESLNSAQAQNESMDYSEDESGSQSWERAGRYVRRW